MLVEEQIFLPVILFSKLCLFVKSKTNDLPI